MKTFKNTLSGQRSRSQIIVTACFFVCIVILLISPIYNFDIFWHLANGRAMFEQGRIIQEEIFSYTSTGTIFNNHEWLSQFILYCIYHTTSYAGLICFKILATLTALILILRTTTGTIRERWVAGFFCFTAVAAGITRYMVRPHLFSFLGIALTMWILSHYSKKNRTDLPLLSLLVGTILLWNLLHGAVYGLLLMCCFAFAGILTKTNFAGGFLTDSPLARNTLLAFCLATFIAVLSSLFNPAGFSLLELLKSLLVDRINVSFTSEFAPTPFSPPFFLFWLMLGITSLYLVRDILRRRINLYETLSLLSFGVLSVIYLRTTAPFLLVSIPYLSRNTSEIVESMTSRIPLRKGLKVAFPVFCLTIAVTTMIAIKSDNRFGGKFHFGAGIDDTQNSNYPIGAANFVKASDLSGNLYNSNHFGGYLAFHLTPDRPIFHYNHGVLFQDMYQFVHDKSEQEKWNINYAIVGQAIETQYTFRPPEWIPVYWENKAIVLVRDRAENKNFIDRYRIHFFSPAITSEQITQLSANPGIASRLSMEMSTYLSFRKDERVAKLFANLIVQPQLLFDKKSRNQLIESTLAFNQQNESLLL